MSYLAVLPVYAKEILKVGPSTYSMLMMANGAGALLGTLLLASFHRHGHKGLILILTGVLSGITPILFSVSHGVWLFALLVFGAGGSTVAFMAISNTLVQGWTEDQLRGRVMSVFLTTAGTGMAVGPLLVGSLGTFMGTPAAVIWSGAVWLGYLAMMLSLQPALRRAT